MSAVRSDGVLVAAPFLDQDFDFAQAIEDLTVQKFIPEPSVKRLQ